MAVSIRPSRSGHALGARGKAGTMASAELQLVLEMLQGNPFVTEQSPEEMRASLEAMAGTFTLDPDVHVDPITVAGMKAEWITTPAVSPAHAILYLHGGGYVVGSLDTHRELAARLGRDAGARVLTIDYRLAPEHPHPAAVEDAVASYRWLLAQDVAPEHVAIAASRSRAAASASRPGWISKLPARRWTRSPTIPC